MVREPDPDMDPKHSDRHSPKQPRAGAPLSDLVDDKFNKPLSDQIADELQDREKEEPSRSTADDYARGTTEHDDDSET